MDFDEEMVEVAQQVNTTQQTLANDVIEPYTDLTEEKILTTFNIEEQAMINLAGAYTIASCFVAHKKFNNEPIDEQLKAKIDRIESYIKKVKAADLITSDGKGEDDTEVAADADDAEGLEALRGSSSSAKKAKSGYSNKCSSSSKKEAAPKAKKEAVKPQDKSKPSSKVNTEITVKMAQRVAKKGPAGGKK